MRSSLVTAAAVAALGFAGYVFFGPSPQTPANPLGAAFAQGSEEVDTSDIIEMQIGNAEAPVTIIEYASYTCPHCAAFHGGPYKQLKADYIDTGKINFIYREVYFDRFGVWASAIARCAGPDKFFGLTDLLYAGQSDWARAGGGDPTAIVGELRKIGRLAGMEEAAIEACLQDGDKLRALVAWYQENANEHDITSTPSFVINGKKHSNMSFDQMRQIIDAALDS